MKITILSIAILLILPSAVSAAFADAYKGRFLISPADGQAWYLRTTDVRRLPLGSPRTTFVKIKALAEPVTDKVFADLSQVSSSLALAYQGRILSKPDATLWYVDPVSAKLHNISNSLSLNLLIAKQGVKLTYHDFARTHKPGFSEAIDQYSSYDRQSFTMPDGKIHKIDVVKINLSNPKLKIYTLAAAKADCPGKCPAQQLATYVASVKGFAGMNGTYFDTSVAKKHYYFFPIYDQLTGTFMNKGQLKYWTTGPIFAFDHLNRFYYFRDSRDFSKAVKFAPLGITITQGGRSGRLSAAMGNLPKLIENGQNQLIDWALDNKQKTNRSTMNALGYKKTVGPGELSLVTIYNVTLPEQTEILKTMGFDYALNIDGGGSASVYYNHEYMVGPGRDVPNAIVFAQ